MFGTDGTPPTFSRHGTTTGQGRGRRPPAHAAGRRLHAGAVFAAVLLLALHALPVGAAPPTGPTGEGAGLGCAAQCITYGRIFQDGPNLTARIKTSVPAYIQLQIAPVAPVMSPYPHFASPAPIQRYNGAAMTDWTIDLGTARDDGKFITGTTYHAVVIAIDNKGKIAYDAGTFTVKKRIVVVTFESIKVLDNAEKVGKGEIEFFFGVNQNWIPQLHMPTQKIKDGQTVHLPRASSSYAVQNAPHHLILRVQGVEYDPSRQCTGGIPPYNGTGGETSCNDDYATAAQSLDVDNVPTQSTALPQQNEAYFSFETTQHFLKFHVSGYFNVRWE